jgi:hypothetical protein
MANRHKAQAAHKNVGGAVLSYGKPAVVSAAKKSSNNPGAIQKADGGSVEARKEGGKVVGKAAGGRLDKRARGGSVAKKFASGGSPFSAASKVKG